MEALIVRGSRIETLESRPSNREATTNSNGSIRLIKQGLWLIEFHNYEAQLTYDLINLRKFRNDWYCLQQDSLRLFTAETQLANMTEAD